MYWMNLPSPVGQLTLASDGQAITSLWLAGQKYYAATLDADAVQAPERPEFHQAANWLEAYFSGQVPPALPPLAPKGSPFRQAVWRLLLDIPRGQTTTYGALAQRLRDLGLSASAQAVGGAVVDVLFGKVNPSGRLAETFPKKLSDNPSYLYYQGEGDITEYREGVYVGYRYYDKKEMEVLYPFGHVLSYTTFAYRDLKADKAEMDDTDTLTVTL